MVSSQQNPKTENVTRNWDITVIDLTMLLIGGLWIWGKQLKGSGAEGDLNCWGFLQEDSEEKNFSMLLSDHSCDILVKNETAFCP